MVDKAKVWSNKLSIDETIQQIIAKANSFSNLFDETFLKSIKTSGREITLIDRILNAPHDLCMNFIDRKLNDSTETINEEPLYFIYDQRGMTIIYMIVTKESYYPPSKDLFTDDFRDLGSAYVRDYIKRKRSTAGIIEFTELNNNAGHYLITASTDYELQIKNAVDQLLIVLEQIHYEDPPIEELAYQEFEKYKVMVLEYVNEFGRRKVKDFLDYYNEKSSVPFVTTRQFQRDILPMAAKKGWIVKSHPDKNTGYWVENFQKPDKKSR